MQAVAGAQQYKLSDNDVIILKGWVMALTEIPCSVKSSCAINVQTVPVTMCVNSFKMM